MYRSILCLLISLFILAINKNYLLETISYPLVEARFFLGLGCGFSLFYMISEWSRSRVTRSDIKLKVFAFLFLATGFFQVINILFIKAFFNYKNLIHEQFFVCAVIGFVAAIIFQRVWIWLSQKITSKNSIKSTLERTRKSDIRDLAQSTNQAKEEYDPKKFFKNNAYFLALDGKNQPIYWTEKTLPHIEVCGTTGCGKGVFLGNIAAQCAKKGESVFVVDPKDDEWLPHVVYSAAKDAHVRHHFIDLRKQSYQFNLFEDASPTEVEELLLAGFELCDKGEAADFYKLADRAVATFVSKSLDGQTAEKFWAANSEYLSAEAEGFAGKFKELADIKAINAQHGLSLKEIITHGGMVYIVGSMRNAKIIRVQKMLLVRLIQLAESRDRIHGNLKPICVVLDELKYHLSRTALEALGAARDKGLHLVMAHQSIADLRDCPKDLEPESVVGAVLENTRIKLVYRVEMPETAEIFAEKSGTILVDDETRLIDRSLSLAEKVHSERRVSQSETNLIDKNKLLTLSAGYGVLFGVGLARLVHTSPYKTDKSLEAIKTQDILLDTDKTDPGFVDFERLN